MLLLLLLWNREPKHKTVAVTQAITAKDRLQLLALSQSSLPLPIRPSLRPSCVTIGILPFRVSWIWAVHMLHTCLYRGGGEASWELLYISGPHSPSFSVLHQSNISLFLLRIEVGIQTIVNLRSVIRFCGVRVSLPLPNLHTFFFIYYSLPTEYNSLIAQSCVFLPARFWL